jgi:hypothetical protein
MPFALKTPWLHYVLSTLLVKIKLEIVSYENGFVGDCFRCVRNGVNLLVPLGLEKGDEFRVRVNMVFS